MDAFFFFFDNDQLLFLAEMPDNAAGLLGTCCKLQIIPTLCHLVRHLTDWSWEWAGINGDIMRRWLSHS